MLSEMHPPQKSKTKKWGLGRRNFIKKVTTSSLFVSSGLYAKKTLMEVPRTKAGKAPKILLHTGWNINIIGDQGHTPGTLRFFEQHFPEADVTTWLASTDEVVNAMLRKRFPNIKIIQGTLNEKGVANNPELQQAFDEADLVIQNSGMSFNTFWKTPAILEACNSNNKPLCNYAQSFDGFKKEDEAHMAKELSKVAANYCRDMESYYYLRQIGVTSKILGWGPDGCFGIDLRNDAMAEAYMEEHDLEHKKFIAINIRTNSSNSKKPKKLPKWYVGDTSQNPYEPTEDDEIQNELWGKRLREITIHWVEHTGLKVLLAPEAKKEIEHMKRLVYDPLPGPIKKNVVFKKEYWNMDEACSVFNHAHTLIGMEPHSLIMALPLNVPIIHYFSARHGVKAWMFRDIGLPEWLYDIDKEPSEGPISALMDIYQDYDRAVTKTKRAMELIESRSAEMMNDLKRILA